MNLLDIVSEEEIRLAYLAVQVRAIILAEKAGSGLKDFHCTLGPDAINSTPEELAREILEHWDTPGTLIENVDGDLEPIPYDAPFENDPPRCDRPAQTLGEFLKDQNVS